MKKRYKVLPFKMTSKRKKLLWKLTAEYRKEKRRDNKNK